MIEGLLEYMVPGNLFMPAMTWRTVTPAQPLWDEIPTASETGVLTEVFRKRYSAARSIHPTHSVAGWGPDAPATTSTQRFTTSAPAGTGGSIAISRVSRRRSPRSTC
jgi:aminoglycoside 3-N-acetyltransferase